MWDWVYCNNIFIKSVPLGLSVIESPCPSVCVSVCLSVTIQNTLFQRSWRPLVKLRPPNISMRWHNLIFFFPFWWLWQSFLGGPTKKSWPKKHNGGVIRGRVCGSGSRTHIFLWKRKLLCNVWFVWLLIPSQESWLQEEGCQSLFYYHAIDSLIHRIFKISYLLRHSTLYLQTVRGQCEHGLCNEIFFVDVHGYLIYVF